MRIPLNRYLRSRDARRARARRTRAQDYADFCRWQPCCLQGQKGTSCDGRVESIDNSALCKKHRREMTGRTGYFRGWDKDRMKAWCAEKDHFHKNLYKHLLALRQTPWRRKRA